MAEQIAKDPSFLEVTKQLQESFGGMMGGMGAPGAGGAPGGMPPGFPGFPPGMLANMMGGGAGGAPGGRSTHAALLSVIWVFVFCRAA